MIGSCVTYGTPSIALGTVMPWKCSGERLVHLVLHHEPDPVAGAAPDLRARDLPVERHRVHELPRGDLPLELRGGEVELLHAPVHDLGVERLIPVPLVSGPLVS